MKSVLDEIKYLRRGRSLSVDSKNANRYAVVSNETNGTKTAYFFGAPIYNIDTRKMLDFKFKMAGDTAFATGSNVDIVVSDDIRLQNNEAFCVLRTGKAFDMLSENEIKFGNDIVSCTSNGILYKAECENGAICFELETNKPFAQINTNGKYFALMSESQRPFVTVSCIGAANTFGEIIAPATVRYYKLSDRKYKLIVEPCDFSGNWVVFEFNMYEPKLWQDTTVESANPKTNNVFGSIAFIGNTAGFGEQWLYSRLDFSKLSELGDKRINSAVLHLPKHNNSNVELSAFRVPYRFCSFGSNWDNKVEEAGLISTTTVEGKYHNLDVLPIVADTKSRNMVHSEGLILKTRIKGSGFSVVSTGDCYWQPQILEINYQNI